MGCSNGAQVRAAEYSPALCGYDRRNPVLALAIRQPILVVETLGIGAVAVNLVPESTPDIANVGTARIGGNLDRASHPVCHVLNKPCPGRIPAAADLMGENKLGVRVDRCPQPEIPALLFLLGHPLPVDAHILPLLIHLDPLARQITEIPVHVIRHCFAGLFYQPQNRVFSDPVHPAHGIDRRPFAQGRKNVNLLFAGKSFVCHV